MVGKNHYCPKCLKDLELKWFSVDLQFAPHALISFIILKKTSVLISIIHMRNNFQ